MVLKITSTVKVPMLALIPLSRISGMPVIKAARKARKAAASEDGNSGKELLARKSGSDSAKLF